MYARACVPNVETVTIYRVSQILRIRAHGGVERIEANKKAPYGFAEFAITIKLQ